MLKPEQMKEQAPRFLIEFDEISKQVVLTKDTSKSGVLISTKRAIQWVNAGVEDLECRSKEEMLELLNSWL